MKMTTIRKANKTMDLKRSKVIWADIGTLHTTRGKAQEKDRRMRQWAGGVSHSPAACSGNSLEHKKVGWWMVNSLRKVGYTQMHPSCHMNYSSPTVCTGFGKQQKDFKAGLKDEWMSTWIKRVGKMNYKKIQWVANTNTAFSLQNEGQWRKRNLLFQCPMLFIVSLAYNWFNTKCTGDEKIVKGLQNCDLNIWHTSFWS